MLTVQDLQFHPAWEEERETARDFTCRGPLDDFSPDILAELGQRYLAFATDHPGDVALQRAMQCLRAAAARGVESAREQLVWLERALAAA